MNATTFGTQSNNMYHMGDINTIQNFMTYQVYFAPVWLIGIIGNVMVIMVILKTKEMRNSTNIFLMSLAIADLIYLITGGTLNVLISEAHSNGEDMIRNKLLCNALPFLNFMVFNASPLIILAIGFDRYYAICQPMKAGYICTKRRAYITSLLVWAIAALSSCGNPFIWMYPTCHSQDFDEPNSRFMMDPTCYFYFVISTLVLFVLPLFILIVHFVLIFQCLKVAEAPYVNTAAIRHRRHVIKMLATVVCCFFVCHLPLRVEFIFCTITDVHNQVILLIHEEGHSEFLLFDRFMLYVHCVVNPILYNLMSKKFRQGFKKIFLDIANGLAGLLKSCCCYRKNMSERTTDISIL